ncbi:alpha/beta hydrolase family protein [Erythrobacter crassostreae]|uniref:Dienelactone hydrolase family protein n=1 Tax=Erythrobacter crassostreae TaxID=2828328 RepID=A0A9X1JMM4_9SPHN|nr:dienelactone hydrolase family protein [Erythrobacter crassostrea]MBV7258893.1 dienelactone hydrolase family protein [Erythrobacter crassostrea]
MKKRHIALAAVALIGVGAGSAAIIAAPTVHEGAPGEMPELGRYGDFTVGTQEITMALPDRVTFSKSAMVTGGVEPTERALKVRMYYPATPNGQDPVNYSHTMAPPDMEPVTLDYEGRAFEGAPALADGTQYPLVIMSHGFNGWSTQFSDLAEHIASRGYVVASIDHADMKLEGLTDFLHSFAQVLASRSLDQRQVLAQILERGGSEDGGIFGAVDPEQVAVIGYSMGGYGALATAGGDYDYESGTFGAVPAEALDPVRAAASEDSGIDAVVAFAPWGGQSDNRVWSEETLGKITAPVLIVAGNQDDVSNYEDGISWIFNSLSGADAHMLVFREARHNIVGNDFDLPEGAPFRAMEFLKEPVWRQDRINGINQHFVAAFLDLHLKGDADKAAYLNVPVPNANDSTWETSTGEQLNGKLAGDSETGHWRGFQRRWAVGLDMLQKPAGK